MTAGGMTAGALKVTLADLVDFPLFGRRKRPRGAPAGPRPPSGMALREVDYTVPPIADRRQIRRDMENVRPAFLRKLARYNQPALKAVGISDTEIAEMRRNGYVPHGFSVHHRMPVGGGGTNDFSNLVLIRDKPHHKSIHDYLDRQLNGIGTGETRRITLPWPEGAVFVPPRHSRADTANRLRAAAERRAARIEVEQAGPPRPELALAFGFGA